MVPWGGRKEGEGVDSDMVLMEPLMMGCPKHDNSGVTLGWAQALWNNITEATRPCADMKGFSTHFPWDACIVLG